MMWPWLLVASLFVIGVSLLIEIRSLSQDFNNPKRNWYITEKTERDYLVNNIDKRRHVILLVLCILAASAVAITENAATGGQSSGSAGAYALPAAVMGALGVILAQHFNTQSTVMTKSRQDWINSLRTHIAEYKTCLIGIITIPLIDNDYRQHQDRVSDKDMRKIDETKEKEMRISMLNRLESSYRNTRLFTNPKEDDHNDLIHKMNDAYKLANEFAIQMSYNTMTPDDIRKKAEHIKNVTDEMTYISQQILKREWERVKRLS